MAYSIDIRDAVTPALQRMSAAMAPGQLNRMIGLAGVKCVKEHLFALDSARPNRLRGNRKHFYSQAAKSTHYTLVPDGALISISQIGAAQRYFGGTIKPVKAKCLTIPACAEAYGKRAREFNSLRYVQFGRGSGAKKALVEAAASMIHITKKRKQVKHDASILGTKVYYWLVPSVVQQPDPTFLPAWEVLAAAIMDKCENYFARIKERT
jgi:hypothetical protein